VGEAVREALIVNDGFPPDRVEVVYNGIDLTPFEARPEDRPAIRRSIGLGPEDFVVIQVARLDPIKDHATALHAFRDLARRRPDARLVIVGEGPQLGAIQARLRELEIGGGVRLLGLRSDVARLLSAADVSLLTSLSEGIPLTIIEAMAAGLPVVATRVGGVGEVVEDGVHGFLADPGDAAALAGHLLRLAADPALRAELGRRGRDRAFAIFAEDRMVDRYVDLYRAMTDARRHPLAAPEPAGLRG
jgi:glycosyltransferase involved in cell wall biosynthesis